MARKKGGVAKQLDQKIDALKAVLGNVELKVTDADRDYGDCLVFVDFTITAPVGQTQSGSILNKALDFADLFISRDWRDDTMRFGDKDENPSDGAFHTEKFRLEYANGEWGFSDQSQPADPGLLLA